MADQYFDSVELLLHGEGSDASTTFTDSSANGFTPSVLGNAQIDTGQFKYGSASMQFDGTGDYLSYADNVALRLGAGDFTLESWVYITASSDINVIWAKGSNGSDGTYFYINAATRYLGLAINTSSLESTTEVTLNAWHHVAAARSGTALKLFVDGTEVASGTLSASDTSTAAARIGRGRTTSTNYLTGWVDDFRLTKGIARYTESFTAPTAAFPDTEEFHTDGVTGTLTLTGYAPTVDDGDNEERVTGVTGVITFVGNAPTVNDGATNDVLGVTGILTLVGNAGVVQALKAQQVNFATQSSLAAYTTYQIDFATQSSIFAYTAKQIDFASQSSILAYLTSQIDFASQSAILVYVPHQADFVTQSAVPIYRVAQVEFPTQSAILAYLTHQVEFPTLSALAAYAAQQVKFPTQSAIAAYAAQQVKFPTQSALLSYLAQQANFASQSALPIYAVNQVEFPTQSAIAAYKAWQAKFPTQSAMLIYGVNTVNFASQSALNAYTAQQVWFATQSFLDANERFYGWLLNLTTRAVSKADGYTFNSISGDLGADSSGIHGLYGDTDNGAAINGFVQTGLLDFASPNAKFIPNAYVRMKGGAATFSVEAENSAVVPYAVTASADPITRRLLLARGAYGGYWDFKIANVAGSKVRIDTMEVLVDASTRRV